MKAIRLFATSDDSCNSLGLAIKGMDIGDNIYAAREGFMIAHDLLDHQNGPANIGMIWDEFEALGALWYSRGQYMAKIIAGYFSR